MVIYLKYVFKKEKNVIGVCAGKAASGTFDDSASDDSL